MIFNSFTFLVFFVVVFLIYHLLLRERTKAQNILLLIASYFFYGYADWRMLPILVGATIIYYILSIYIEKCSEKNAARLKTIGVIFGIGLLGYFKYLNFFVDAFATLFTKMGMQVNEHSFNIIMPLGISFFTFRLISYVLEVHRGRIQASHNFVNFATYVAFFPCILSGPIDRPNTFLPQLETKRIFDYAMAVDGCRQVLWGLFKKVVIADNLATYVDLVWNNSSSMIPQSGSTLVLAMILYLLQLYADFSGYSDMAIGISKLLGIRIANNFKTPLFALNIADYWKRWHISLTSWLTDYIFVPLNVKYRDLGMWGTAIAILVTFSVSGLWHGANWTYVLWGVYHGLLYLPLIFMGAFYKKAKLKTNKLGLPIFKDFCRILLTMLLVIVGLLLFRAPDVSTAWIYTKGIFNLSMFTIPNLISKAYYIPTFLTICMMLIIEWINRDQAHGLNLDKITHAWIRYVIYYVLMFFVLINMGEEQTFIYFQF